jgi:L-ascorbate metabolism protein UlaG (beta-lactamase superfamily)
MKKTIITFIAIIAVMNLFSENNEQLRFTPIEHASFVIQHDGLIILVDPVGKVDQYQTFGQPDIILITHIHGDHYQPGLLANWKSDQTLLIGPPEVTAKLGYGQTIKNGECTIVGNMILEAIPMYNLTPERLRYHQKGVGNGYILTLGGERIYIAGDTEDIPEMRTLQNIDHAFICMNLPFTMSPVQAADAVLAFKPRNVYPYHYRNQQNDYKPVYEDFKNIVSQNPEIQVHYLKWYKDF